MNNEEHKEHNPYDKIVKENLRELMGAFLNKIVGVSVTKAELEEVKDKIQRTLEREPDFVYLVDPKHETKYCLHIEFQASDESGMQYRMLEYLALLYRKYKVDVKQYVIYLGEEVPTKMKQEIIFENVHFRYNLVCLHNVSYTKLIDSDKPEEVILSILCDREKMESRELIRIIIKNLKSITNSTTLRKYVFQLRMLSQLRNEETIVKEEEIKMIDTIPIDIRKDPYYKEGRWEGQREGQREGRREGLREGRWEGLREGRWEGRQKGEEFGLFKTALNCIKKDYSDGIINDLTGLSQEKIILIRKKYKELGKDIFEWLNKYFDTK